METLLKIEPININIPQKWPKCIPLVWKFSKFWGPLYGKFEKYLVPGAAHAYIDFQGECPPGSETPIFIGLIKDYKGSVLSLKDFVNPNNANKLSVCYNNSGSGQLCLNTGSRQLESKLFVKS